MSVPEKRVCVQIKVVDIVKKSRIESATSLSRLSSRKRSKLPQEYPRTSVLTKIGVTCTHAHTHTQTCTHTRMHAHTLTQTCTHRCSLPQEPRTHTRTHTHTHAHTHAHTHTHARTAASRPQNHKQRAFFSLINVSKSPDAHFSQQPRLSSHTPKTSCSIPVPWIPSPPHPRRPHPAELRRANLNAAEKAGKTWKRRGFHGDQYRRQVTRRLTLLHLL